MTPARPAHTPRPARGSRPRIGRIALALLCAGGLAAATAPAADAATGTTLTYLPAQPVADTPTELTFRHDAPSRYTVYAYKQSPSVACAPKPSLQTNSTFESIDGDSSFSGPDITRVTTTFDEPLTFRVCVYLQPLGTDEGSYSATPLAVTPINVTVRQPRSTLAVAGFPTTIRPGSAAFSTTFTTSTEAPRDVVYELLPGTTCPVVPSSDSSVYAHRSDQEVNGGPTTVTENVDLSEKPTGVYTWCGYSGDAPFSGAIDTKVALGTITIATPAPPPAVVTPKKPTCKVAQRRVRRGRTMRIRCKHVSGEVRVRYKRRGTTVTRKVTLRRGVARATTRKLARGTWKVSILSAKGKIGSGRVTIKRR